MRILLAHLDQEWENRDSNRIKVKSSISLANQYAAELIIFPEMTLTGFSMRPSVTVDSEDNRDLRFFQECASQGGVGIVAGGVKEAAKDVFNNRCWLISEAGELLHEYSKCHMFGFGGEAGVHQPGHTCEAIDWRDHKWGFGICYDLRFAMHPLCLTKSGATTLVYIANWPVSRKDHWMALLKARAIEMQCNVVGVDRTGVDGMGLDYGVDMSCAWMPNGEAYALRRINAENSIVDIDLQEPEQFRRAFPAFIDQRWSLYKEWLDA